MSTHPSTPASPYRLERSLFWLRWVLLAGTMVILIWGENGLQDAASTQQERAATVLIAAIASNILFGLAAYSPQISSIPVCAGSVILDSAIAASMFWVSEGKTAPLVILGAMTVVVGAYRRRWSGMIASLALLTLLSAGAALQFDDSVNPNRENIAIAGLTLAAFGSLGVLAHTSGATGTIADERAALGEEALRLRAARERAHAIYEMANTLGTTVDYRHVLEAAQDIGMLGLRELADDDIRLISAVLLFQGEDNKLHVITSRRLTRADEQVATEGTRGVIGLALKQAEPVFGGEATHDPELRYFAGFQPAKSVLAIPLRAGYDNYGVLVFGSDQPNAFSDEHVELLTAIGTQSTIALQRAVLYQNLIIEKEKIVEVEEDARKKLARDLHDGPTQSVAAIAMRVNYIRRLIERQPQQAIEELWKVEELARRTTKEIRHMLFTLRPLVLETQGLIAALKQLAEKMRDTHNCNVLVESTPGIEHYIDKNAQGILFYVVEEAVNNARKHAQAEHIYVRLYERGDLIAIEIEDDGVGFDVVAVDSGYEKRGSLGMVNMRERAELIEGRLHIDSVPGRGTKISILIPREDIMAGDGLEDDLFALDAPLLNLQSQRSAIASSHSTSPAASQPSPPESPDAPSEAPPQRQPTIRRLSSQERRPRPSAD